MANNNGLPIVILISGNGSNLQAIIDSIEFYNLPVTIRAVISSHENAYGLERAKRANIPAHFLGVSDFQDRASYDSALANLVARYSPELILLAGFMRILGLSFLSRFKNKIINIHPSLLPQYPGLNTHKQALEEGIFEHGCSIHFVDENLDAGPLIAQAVIKVASDDTVASLKERVHRAEHFLYPTVLNWFSQRRISLNENKIFIDQVPLPKKGLRFILHL